ncbi:Peptidyl-prolyl cis-trans isomerase pin4 [Linderina macrospora]|uniref:Peptidyl-prolyl cis-trans isomerase pin4 n=1 Tax=Linderina macrospora TaxID=4868 RepID=A0ACC1JGY4_9FUNG|nr:Peptidyl-prolyl cis-trans isomerase pin4 [Linderina macrospora]
MSKAIEETLRKLEGTHISNGGSATSGSPTTTSAPSPAVSNGKEVAGSEPSSSSNSPATAASVVVQTPEQALLQAQQEAELARRRGNRRVVQSMYGAPPGYNASMGIGRESMARGRMSSGGGRQRSSIMIPLQAAMHQQALAPMSQLQGPTSALTNAEFALMANMPDDAIPNAIVVKNINFAIKRETLLQTMSDLGLPLPYAFNYHFDGGVFRGLAFGNFRTPEEAARVIVGLNGIMLLGRPLKVEYKKALPGMPPPPHPNTIALMGGKGSGNDDQPIPRPQRAEGAHERPKSMMVFPSAMPEPAQQQQQRGGSPAMAAGATPGGNNSSGNNDGLIDLDDKDTRLLYDLVSQFRHDKSMAELEFPSTLNVKQRQTVMLIAERFGLNHETKGDSSTRYIRVYKGLETLLEAAEVRRRSMAMPGGGIATGAHPQPRYASAGGGGGRARPVSMMYPETMSIGSPPASAQQHRASMYQPAYDPQMVGGGAGHYVRGRSHTHSQGHASVPGSANHMMQFPWTPDTPSAAAAAGRTSGNYVGYPTRLYQDSVVVPVRQPRGPDMPQNFVGRQQIHQQEERQQQRQHQLRVLQQNRQRRLSSANDDGAHAPASASSAAATTPLSAKAMPFRIEKPVSKAIPIVKPKESVEPAEPAEPKEPAK